MPFNTQNPIPSGDLRDLDDNARNIDTWANDKTKLSHPDRFGEERYTWHGIEQKAQLDIEDAARDAAHQAASEATVQANDARDAAFLARDQAIAAKISAANAAAASGVTKYADTKAILTDGIGAAYVNGDVVLVFTDESRSGASAVYKIESNSAVFKTLFDQTRADLLSFTGDISAAADWSDIPAHSDPAFDVQAQALANRAEYLSQRINAADLSGLDGASKIKTADGRTVQQRLDALPNEVDAAGTAESLLALHDVDPDAHPELFASVEVIKEQAEAARDAAVVAALTAPGVYATEAEGRAAVADGESFFVQGADFVASTLYRRINATESEIISELPSKSFVDEIESRVQKRSNREYLWGVVDKEGKIALGIKRSGKVVYESNPLVEIDKRSGYLWGVVDDQSRIALGLDYKGNLIVKGQDFSSYFDDVGYLNSAVDSLKQSQKSSLSIVCWGDSMTEGAGSSGGLAYPAQLASLMGRTVVNRGRGGQNSEQIAARAGGIGALLSVAGDTIPASGSVAVTSISPRLMFYAGGAWSIQGKLAGVQGSLHEDGDNGYSFVRAEAGAAVRCWPDTPFIPDNGNLSKSTAVIWVGRNDFSNVSDPAELTDVVRKVIEAVDSIVGTLDVTERRFVILGVTSRQDANEYTGTANYTAKRDLVKALARKYPKNFLDIDKILRESGSGSGQDAVDYANGVVPSSLRSDNTHLNNEGYAIVANAINKHLLSMGW